MVIAPAPSYPHTDDRERARKLGVTPGGGVEIHGLESKYAWVGSLHQQVNWTAGCIAVTNPEIDEIWPLLTAYAAGKNGITSCLPTIRERREPATFTAQFCTR